MIFSNGDVVDLVLRLAFLGVGGNDAVRNRKDKTMNKLIVKLVIAAALAVGYGTLNAAFADQTPKNGATQGLKYGLKNGLKNGEKKDRKEGLHDGLKDGQKNGLKYGLKNGLKNGAKNGDKKGSKGGRKSGRKGRKG